MAQSMAVVSNVLGDGSPDWPNSKSVWGSMSWYMDESLCLRNRFTGNNQWHNLNRDFSSTAYIENDPDCAFNASRHYFENVANEITGFFN